MTMKTTIAAVITIHPMAASVTVLTSLG